MPTPAAYYCYDASFDTMHANYENAIACSNPKAVSNPIGRLTKVTNGTATSVYGDFDALGRVLAHSQTTASHTYGFQYTYNLAGDLSSEKYPSGRLVSTCYDAAERVSQVGGSCQSLGLPAYVTGATNGSGKPMLRKESRPAISMETVSSGASRSMDGCSC